jgi:type I restriction enzyme S subunit
MATNQGFQSLVPGPDVLPYFLMCWIQANRAEFESRASGSTFAEISGRNVKAIPITIPPFSEQRRIVDLVGSIDSYLEALDGEHRLVEFAYRASTEAMWGAEAKSVRLSDVMSLDIDRVRVEPSARYRLIGILNEGKGLIDKGEISGHETSYATLNRVRDRQVVMRKLTAWEGPIAVVTTQFADTFASAEFPTFAISERLLPSYFGHLCGTSRLRVEMRLRVTGSVQRRKRLSPEQLLSIEVPLPDIEAQQATVERLDAILSLAAALAREKAAGREMRERVLAALLSRQVEIPASYDRLLAD